jgi:UV DNA damage endonuclease
MIRLGYACVNLTLGQRVRGLRLATFRTQGLPYLQQLVNENIDLLVKILRWNYDHRIMMYRLSSDLIPLGSHAEVNFAALELSRTHEIAALKEGMRLSMHPGQYTLPSASGSIWERSYQDLCYHANLMDRLGIENGDIILHGGGVYGDRAASQARIIENISSLPTNVKKRLRLENDERSWSVDDLLPICEQTRTPLVVDNLHHQLNSSQPFQQLPWERILATWQGQRPKVHYSEQAEGKRPGAHSEYVSVPAFRTFYCSLAWIEYDVMLECKAKEQALLRLCDELGCEATDLRGITC